MKNPILLLITLFFCFSNNLVAQIGETESTQKQKFHEFGINVTTFINEFISLNNNEADLGDYMVTYKYHMGKNALRFGIGGKFRKLDEPVGGGNRISKENKIDLRAGYEWNKPITKKWSFYYGFDAIGGTFNSVTKAINNDEITTTDQNYYFGGGGVIGVQFFINSHISLSTEGSIYYQHETITTKAEFASNPGSNTDETSINDVADFGLPTALFFVIRF